MLDYNAMSADELMLCVRDDDDGAALLELHKRYNRKLVRYFQRCTNDSDDSDDLALAVWVKVWFHRKTYQPTCGFEPWFWRIAQRVLYDWLRARQRRPENQLDDLLLNWLMNQVDEAEDVEFKAAYRRAWEQLPPPYREILQWRCLDGCTWEETAKRILKSIPTASRRLRLARARFRLELEKAGIQVDDLLPPSALAEGENDEEKESDL